MTAVGGPGLLPAPGAGIDETEPTDSNPRDSFNISAPNWCKAVIVDGVGSGMLEWERGDENLAEKLPLIVVGCATSIGVLKFGIFAHEWSILYWF